MLGNYNSFSQAQCSSMYFREMAITGWSQSDWSFFIRLLFSYASVTNLCRLILVTYIAIVKLLKYCHVVQIVALSWGIQVAVRIVHIVPPFLLKNPPFSGILVRITLVLFELVPCLILIFCFLSMLHVVRRYERAACTTAKQFRFSHRVSFKIFDGSC